MATRDITAAVTRGGLAFRTETRVLDISNQLVANSAGSAAANAAAIAAALAAASASAAGLVVVAINVPGIYYIQQVSVPSNVTLSVGAGVTLRKDANYLLSMFINSGALAGTPARNSNIAIIGEGTIDGNSSTQSGLTKAVASITTGTFLYGIQGEVAMIGVDNFTYSLRNLYNCNGFGIQFTGTNAYIAGVQANTCRDFIHIGGPSTHIIIERCTGFSSDDFIALNAWDWKRSCPTVGDITDVTIRDVAYYGSNNVDGVSNRNGNFIKFLCGTRATGNGAGTGNLRNVRVSGFRVDTALGSVTTRTDIFGFPADYDQVDLEYAGTGAISDVLIEGGTVALYSTNGAQFAKSTAGSPADGQTSTTIKNVEFRNVHFDASGSSVTATKAIYLGSAYTTYLVSGLKVTDCDWTPGTVAAQQIFLQVASKSGLQDATIDGLTIGAANGANYTPVVLLSQYSGGNPSNTKALHLSRIRTAAGVLMIVPWLTFGGGTADFISARALSIIGSGAGNDQQGVHFFSSTSAVGLMVFEDCNFDAVKVGMYVDVAPSAAIAARFLNCRFNAVVHPIFVNAAATVDLSFVGCSINSGNNLARIANAAAVVVMSFLDTISSGVGAAIITAAAAANIRIRNSDRIQLPAAVLATNPPTPQNNDVVNFAATPSYTGSVVISGTGAGLYVYRGTGTVGWVKLN